MSTPPSFPTLAGQGWSVTKKPIFSTRVAPHVSGRNVRLAMYQNPLYEFEVVFDGLSAAASGYTANLGAQSLQTLMGFFMQCQGQAGTFLYTDPTDNLASAQTVGLGDGTTTTFAMGRTLGGWYEPVGWVTSIASVTLNSVVQGSGWSLTTPNSLVFSSAPGAGVIVAATFNFAFQCQFDEDDLAFENWSLNLWKAEGVKFRTVRSS